MKMMLKVVKLTNKQLNMEPIDLLKSVGLIDYRKNASYPEKIYVSTVDYKKIKKNTERAFKKQYKGTSKEKLDVAIGMHLLNYSPNTSLGEGIKSGYALVEVERN
jgi:hypothetical protein